MRNKILKNRGMLLENLIERTSIYSEDNNFYIEKRNLPIKIIKKDNKYIKGKIIGLATIDYFGFKDGKYFEIEAKQTEEDFFKKSNIRKEQIIWSQMMSKKKITVYLIVMFSDTFEIFITTIENISKQKVSKIKKDWFIQNSVRVDVITPGILNIANLIK